MPRLTQIAELGVCSHAGDHLEQFADRTLFVGDECRHRLCFVGIHRLIILFVLRNILRCDPVDSGEAFVECLLQGMERAGQTPAIDRHDESHGRASIRGGVVVGLADVVLDGVLALIASSEA